MKTPSFAVAALFAAALLFGALPSAAQQAQINGRVVDDGGQGLANVQVSLIGTEIGALTGADGRFTLTAPPGSYEVRVQSIGYSTITRAVEVEPGETESLTFRMSVRAIELEQVVVSLDAVQASRAEIGTDFERFNAELETDKGAVTDLSSLLNSRAPALSISQSAGSAGAASTIRVRGSSSITQDNNPIIYIDGVRTSNATGTGPGSFDFGNGQTVSRLNDINPLDIASVQVLKGPTAAALYGSEAAAGVILIETKRGQAGAQQFNLTIEQGLNRDVADYWDNFYNLTANAGVTSVDDPEFRQFRPILNPVTGDVFARHNPMEDPFTDPRRNAYAQRYTLEARGGSESVRYFGSFRWEDEQGTLPNNDLRRISFRANLEAAPSDQFDLSLSTGFVDSDVRLPDNDRSAVGMVTNAGAGLPLFSFGSEGDCLATLVAGLPASACEGREGNLTANFDKLATIQNTQEVGRFIGSATANWRPRSWLSARGTLGLDHVQTSNQNLVPLDPDRPFGSNSDGLINDTRITEQNFSAEGAVTIQADLTSRLSSSTTVGTQFFSTDVEQVGCSGEGGFASPSATACNAALTFTGQSDRVEIKEAGAYVQERIGLEDYLFVTGALRVDDNSAFGEEQDAIVSPSASVSAILSRMSFWDVSFVDELRLRFAWGEAAQAPSPFAASQTFRPVRLDDNGTQVTGISPLDPGNANLAPERNEEFELGFDAGLFNNRFSLKFTYFDQTTTDAIVATNVAPSTGFSGSQFVNIGEIENSGWEASVGGILIDNNAISWDATVRLSTNDPVVTSLGGEPPILFGLGADHQMFREGFAPGAYYGNVIGNAERDGNGDIIPGSIEFLPGNVGPDGGPDPDNPNHRFLGNPEPTNQQSVSSTLTFLEDFRVFTLFDRSGGFSKFDDSNAFRSPFIPNITGSRDFAMRQAESTPEEQASMEAGGDVRTWVFVDDASFVKWRELTVTYSVPESIAQRVSGAVNGLTLSLGARNLATWTDYRGLDPELRFDGGRDSFNAAEFFTQPPTRYFFFRVSAGF